MPDELAAELVEGGKAALSALARHTADAELVCCGCRVLGRAGELAGESAGRLSNVVGWQEAAGALLTAMGSHEGDVLVQRSALHGLLGCYAAAAATARGASSGGRAGGGGREAAAEAAGGAGLLCTVLERALASVRAHPADSELATLVRRCLCLVCFHCLCG